MESPEEKKLEVMERFSGIGGMHYALRKADIEAEVVAAMDISDVANRVYKHNFPSTPHFSSNICGLTARKLNAMGVEAILMSPPCQPFTRQGKQKDLGDARTEPLVNIIEILPKLASLKFLLVENVKGFESSRARGLLVATLYGAGFAFREFLLTPTEAGYPNSRLRYYLIARKRESTGATKAFEAGKLQRSTLVEFDSLEAAIAAHETPEYKKALAALEGGVTRDLRIVEGIE